MVIRPLKTETPPAVGEAAKETASPKTVPAGEPTLSAARALPSLGEPEDLSPPAFDARAQAARLREAFAPETPQPVESKSPPRIWQRIISDPAWNIWAWRVGKTAVALLLFVVVGWEPLQRLLALSSTEAVVNARLVTLRAPIDGEIATIASGPKVGSPTDPGRLIVRIVNSRADRGRLDDLRRTASQLESERPVLIARISRLKELHAEVSEQAAVFQRGRTRELEARQRETQSAIAGASATREEALASEKRIANLAASNAISATALEKARRDRLVAAETENGLRHRLTAIEVELEAARQGLYVGDSYNDRPSSTQQADVLAVRIAELEADLLGRDERIAQLRGEVAAETARYAQTAEANLISPVNGRVWEVLVSPGEEIRRGQDLVRLLDCSEAVVTTSVSESVYNKLRIGDSASFRFSGEGGEHMGRVIRLSGFAAPPDNLAIAPSSLLKDNYRVSVAIPDFSGASCALGRTGRVSFQTGARMPVPPS